MGTAPDIIKRLVEHFDRQIDQVRSPDYSEAQLRIDFINPMFRELGWDVDNTQGFAEQYREVVYEDRVKVGGATKAPDYSFRIGGPRKFFLEAKKPFVNIKESWEPAYQLRRYGWSAKLAVSILTDFEEFAVYDCRIQPRQFDKAATARREYFTYRQYEEKWDFLAGTFSKQAVMRGDFDRYCGTTRGKGAAEFDEAFLVEIEEWRMKLASNLALRNDALDERSLNFAVQRIIDRIIFLRICEDRGIERVGRLQALLNGEEVYPRLVRLFEDADARYNSGLFQFKKEKDRDESPDELTPGLDLDDASLKAIIKRLYYPESPYEFTVVSADILGSVYERFLGKVITLTAGHRAKVEEKPEVRKAGGVYYTPTYIVDYIVQQTVGKLLDPVGSALRTDSLPGDSSPEKTVRHADPTALKRASKLTILDPACGSGSFLLGAYQYLLDWHLKWYIANDPAQWSKGRKATLRPGSDGQWRLTTNERKRILLDNIHGVDIDYQAVEVTKLSLLLKVLEGETAESLGGLWAVSHERALPDLGQNIQCGNSLIGTEIMGTEAWETISASDRARINPFDFASAFRRAFKVGGFDAVIGNPPYGYMIPDQQQEFYRRTFSSQDYQLDNYLLFLEKSTQTLMKSPGRFGMIIPNPWLTNLKQRSIRRKIFATCAVDEIVHFEFPVFAAATVDTEVVILSKPRIAGHQPVARFCTEPQDLKVVARSIRHRQDDWISADGDVVNISVDDRSRALAAKLVGGSSKLSDLMDINVGIKPYQVGKGIPAQTRKTVDDRPFDANKRLDPTYRPCLRGSDIGRYRISPREARFLRFGPWLAEPRPAANFDAPRKLFMRQTGDSLIAALDLERRICLNNMHVLVPKDEKVPLEFLLAIVNSRLLNWYYQTINPERGEALAEVKRTHVAALPIRLPIARKTAVRLSSLAATRLRLEVEIGSTKVPHSKDQLRWQIEATDRQIDQLVYELYGLTDDEIRVVEAATAKE